MICRFNVNPNLPNSVLFERSILQYEKARLVAKLKAARQRKRETFGKVEGRKSWAELERRCTTGAEHVSAGGASRSRRPAVERA